MSYFHQNESIHRQTMRFVKPLSKKWRTSSLGKFCCLCSRNSLGSCHPWAFLWTCHINWALESLRIRSDLLSLIKLVWFFFWILSIFISEHQNNCSSHHTTVKHSRYLLHDGPYFAQPKYVLVSSDTELKFIWLSTRICRITNLLTWKVWPPLLSLIVLCHSPVPHSLSLICHQQGTVKQWWAKNPAHEIGQLPKDSFIWGKMVQLVK